MPHESTTSFAQSAEKPQKPPFSQAELRSMLAKKLISIKPSLDEGVKEYKQALQDGLFEDQDDEPEGSGEARKITMQKKLTILIDRAEKLKVKIDSKEPIAQQTQDIQVDYTYTNPQTNTIEHQETITLDIEQKLNEFLSFYHTTHIDLSPDFADTIRDIWDRHYTDIQEAIEQNGFNDLLIIPGNIPLTELKDTMSMENGYFEGNNFKAGGSFASAKSHNADKPRLILVHKTQNLKDRPELAKTLNIQGKDVDQSQALTLEDYLVFQRKYFADTLQESGGQAGKHLDEISWTWLATKSGPRLVDAYWSPDYRKLYVNALDPEYLNDDLGVRPSRCFF